jgi:hypothetical protein
MTQHNGDTALQEQDDTPSSDFSQEELDLEMTVVCAGEFVKEVSPIECRLKADGYEEFFDQDRDVCCSAIGI